MLDVVICYEGVDSAAARTCAAAFEREGWSVFLSNGATNGSQKEAHSWVVIWSQGSLRSRILAQEGREPLLQSRLLQIFLQPQTTDGESPSRRNTVLPPEPFCFHQGLPVSAAALDGSERAIDSMVNHDSCGILRAVARIGHLKRPRDGWNAQVCFRKPYSGTVEPVIVSEFAAEDGRLLRRDEINDGNSFVDTVFETTNGNRWRIVAKRKGEPVTEVVVNEEKEYVDLPRRASWWARLRSI